MLTVKTADQLRHKTELFELVNDRLPDLEKVVGDTLLDVTAEWDVAQDSGGKDVVTLRLSEPEGQTIGIFSTDDLNSPSAMRLHTSTLWGDLLQMYTGRLLKRLLDRKGSAENGN